MIGEGGKRGAHFPTIVALVFSRFAFRFHAISEARRTWHFR